MSAPDRECPRKAWIASFMAVRVCWLCLMSFGLDANAHADEQRLGAEAGGFAVTYRSDWRNGIDPRISCHASDREAVTTVSMAAFDGIALKTTMSRSDDFSGVANGSPRAELAFVGLTRFEVGGDYEVRWSTLIPRDYALDQKQPEIITQIHQSAAVGAPPFSLMLNANRYQVDVRGLHSAISLRFGDPLIDEGRKISWLLRYRPDDTGRSSISDLYKDGLLVAHAGHTENAYPNEKGAYLKLGIYKWNWHYRPSDVVSRTMYYGDIEVSSREADRHSGR